MKINLRSLDCLRGLLAVYVLAGHSRWLLWTGHANWIRGTHGWWENALAYGSASLRYGHEAVMVFFVLSGFFIHLRASQHLARGEDAQFHAAGYFARRAHRLIPPYILALLVTVVADAIGRHFWPTLYMGQTGDALLDANFAVKGYSAEGVIPALVLLPTSLGRDFGSNGPLWSLAFETLFYAVYPLWLRLRLSYGVVAFGLVGILSPLAFQASAKGFLFVVAGHYCLWIAGAGLAEVVCRQRSSKRLVALFLTMVAATLGIGLLVHSPITLLAVYLVLGAGMVAIFGLIPQTWSNNWVLRGMESLGIRSYTIYICHFPLLALVSAWMFSSDGNRPEHGWSALFGGAAILLATLVCFELCEKHFLHRRLHLTPQTVMAD